MKSIINDGFLLETRTAKRLYHEIAKDLPIIDYHCHLDPRLIASDYRFSNIGELMLGGDHYKWRAMRSYGIDEKFITGDASWQEKFRAFAEVIPYCIGNPLYHWTHLELKRYFGIDEALTAKNADEVFARCSEILASPESSVRGLIERSRVELLCTTDDPLDTLDEHRKIAESGFATRVLPTFRPDKAVSINKDTFLPYLWKTGVRSYSELKAWLVRAIERFGEAGCRLSDHGLDFIPYAEGDAAAVLDRVMNGHAPTREETEIYMTDILRFLAKEYSKRGWCMQIHVGALRNNNTKMYRALGADTGFDSISDVSYILSLSRLINSLELENALPKTILYSLDPNDSYTLGTLMGCFQRGPVRSKLQLGSAWWFNDQKDGMEAQLRALGNVGVLGAFVGMLTDSRSFISYPRHEYFRRILCNLIGGWVEQGMYPDDDEALFDIISGICYRNAKNYFSF